MNDFRKYASLSLSLTAAALALLLTGCSGSFAPSTVETESQTPIGVIQGKAFGGQGPISGASIYLMAAGTTGYGSAATSLINNPVGTDTSALKDANGRYYVLTKSDGTFNLGGTYTCTPGTQVYMLAIGGNSGSGANSYVAQMAGLGECPTGGATSLGEDVPYVNINEVSTVVFAYTMAGFYGTDEYHIGSNAANSTNAATAIHNAMANVLNILEVGNGIPYAKTLLTKSGTIPTAKIYSLANALGACVNSAGNLSNGQLYSYTGNGNNRVYTYAQCFSLFEYSGSATAGNKNTLPTITGTPNEAQAAFSIAQNPTNDVASLFGLIPTTPAFAGGLTSEPADWTLPIVYSGVESVFGTDPATNTTISGPFNLAFDSNGNAWIGDRVKGVVEITPMGEVSTYNSGFGRIKGVSVDSSNTIWAVDYSGGTGKTGAIYNLDSAGDITPSPITTGLNGPDAVAFDESGNVYVANETGDSINVYTSTGGALPNSTTCSTVALGNNVTTPGFITVDTNGTAWVPSTSTGDIGEMTVTTTTKVTRGVTTTTTTCAASASGVTSTASYAVLIDSSGKLWVSDYSNSSLDQETTGGFGGYTTHTHTGAIDEPYHIAIDGAGHFWVSSYGAPLVDEWIQTGTGNNGAWGSTTGGNTPGFSTCSTYATSPSACTNAANNVTVVPDPSGNVWVENVDGSVTELLGLATPTAAPVLPNTVGTEP